MPACTSTMIAVGHTARDRQTPAQLFGGGREASAARRTVCWRVRQNEPG